MNNVLSGWRFSSEIYPRQPLDFGRDFPDRIDIAARTGELQKYCQNALRRYMVDGLEDDLKRDGAAINQVSPVSDLAPYTFQIALALSIPAPDYGQLAEFAEIIVGDLSIVETWYPNLPHFISIDPYVLYLMPSMTLAKLKKFFGMGQEQVLKHAAETDDLLTAKKIFAEIHAPFRDVAPIDAKIKLLSSLANIPFQDSKIRQWLTPNQSISLHELHLRVKRQFQALEAGHKFRPSSESDSLDHGIADLPRYQEYLARHAEEFGISLWAGLGGIPPEATAAVFSITKRLVSDLVEALGDNRHRFFLMRKGSRISTYISDLEDEPNSLLREYFTHAVQSYKNPVGQTTKDPFSENSTNILIKEFVAAFIRKEPVHKILKYCTEDESLQMAYKATGNKKLLEAMSDRGHESMFSEDLGL